MSNNNSVGTNSREIVFKKLPTISPEQKRLFEEIRIKMYENTGIPVRYFNVE